jgi:hypothetical protein
MNEVVENKIVIENDDMIEAENQPTIDIKNAMAVVEYDNRAPKISLTEDFKGQTPEAQVKYLHSLASTMNHAAKLLQEERNELLLKVQQKEHDVENAQKAFDLQKNINTTLITQLNESTQERAARDAEFISTINNLKAKLKEYGEEV